MGMPVIAASSTSRCQAITDMIQSVSLEQAAVAHIVNAQGEEIQKAVSLTTGQCEVNKLLDINKSVKSLVNTLSRFEMVLQAKLELFEDCLCPCPSPCPCPNPCPCPTQHDPCCCPCCEG